MLLLDMVVKEFCEEFGYEYDDICLKENGKYVYVSSDDDGCYLGVEYEDKECSVVGLGCDRMCSFDDMMKMVCDDWMYVSIEE